jgi:hypothetical protein
MVMDDAMRDIVTRNPDVNQLRKLAREKGLVTLRQDGFDKVIKGHDDRRRDPAGDRERDCDGEVARWPGCQLPVRQRTSGPLLATWRLTTGNFL